MNLPYCNHIRALGLRNIDSVDDAVVLAICKGCSLLEELDIGHCRITDAVADAIAERIKSLRLDSSQVALEIRFLPHIFFGKITEDGLMRLSARCKEIRELSLDGMSVETLRVTVIASRLPELQRSFSLTVVQTSPPTSRLTDVLWRFDAPLLRNHSYKVDLQRLDQPVYKWPWYVRKGQVRGY